MTVQLLIQICPPTVISSLLVAAFLKPRDEIHTAKDAPPHTDRANSLLNARYKMMACLQDYREAKETVINALTFSATMGQL